MSNTLDFSDTDHDLLTSGKTSAVMTAELCAHYGVKTVFVSPGSRNAPLLVALSAMPEIKIEVVVDERSAGFMALGYAETSGEPVAMCCTSGTALLNYLPAVAEAWYRNVPLIVLSADRPEVWIDQDDSQTLHQPGALSPYVKASIDLDDFDVSNTDAVWYAERELNNCLTKAINGRKAPVHINLRYDSPLNTTRPLSIDQLSKSIDTIAPKPTLSTSEIRALGKTIASPKKVMIVAGFMSPSQKLNRAINRLADLPNVVVIAEPEANLHSPKIISRVDTVLAALPLADADSYKPDVVISFGGALVSRKLKEYLRNAHPSMHWHVSLSDNMIDCFRSLTTRIQISPEVFFPLLASAMQPHRASSAYATAWQKLSAMSAQLHNEFVAETPWSALTAMDEVVKSIPRKVSVQVSNGTSVRYLQLTDTSHLHRVDCNRGVSGIDGCTSTAVGAQLAAKHHPTLLITGDMSLQYDLTALGSTQVTPRFKVIVIDNGGGAIFRFIDSTAKLLPLAEDLFIAKKPFPISELAKAWGFKIFEADNMNGLTSSLHRFFDENERPAMLIVKTDGEIDTTVLNGYFNYMKN